MSTGERRTPLAVELLALAVPLIGAFIELTIRNEYHQISAEPTRFVYLGGIALVSLVLALITERQRSPTAGVRALRAANRLLGLGTWAWIVAARGAGLAGWLAGASVVALVALVAGGVALAWLVSGEARWRRARPAVLIAGTLFVVSQPLLGQSMSPSLVWPATAGSRQAPVRIDPAAAAAAPRPNVVMLLLDELNARDGAVLAQVLADRGMAVARKSIRPVDDATAKVIPEIWTGGRFSNPKPCSFTAICSDGQALDFAKVTASRPDIDVVGFYHPYCAMRGLRWCERVGLPLPFYDADRWMCSLQSRVGLSDTLRCMDLQDEPFFELRAATMAAVWRAPFWREGGMLYAHLPLPHPPGERPGGTLRQDYHDNLALAAEFLGQMVDRARAARLDRLRLVVFSDHPLRQPLWCGKPAYRAQGCQPAADLEDRQVPLIVGTLGGEPPELDAIESNAQVFDLAVLP